jgi:hypothetical protein
MLSNISRQGTILILRLEGAFYLILGLFLYYLSGYSWSNFLMLFFLPDISFIGYLVNPRIGAICYNIMHSSILPIMCFISGEILEQPTLLMISIIWISHIGFDRMLGFGLKFSDNFKHTHLGVLKSQK